jgi:adenylate cyclase
MSAPSLEDIRSCLEGVLPSVLATCARDGTPNVTYVSQVHFVDRGHVALSFQFFNKTRENILVNPNAAVYVIDPRTARRYMLTMRYLRTESSGPLFERMKANLAGIASHTGMSGVFRLQGSDVYEVVQTDLVPGTELTPPPPRCNLLGALRRIAGLLSTATDLRTLLDDVLAVLGVDMAITHAMVLLTDAAHDRLYTVASLGYPASGVGSEIPLGQGLIGIAARERTPIRITHGTSEYTYSLALRKSAESDGLAALLETKIPLPGLAHPGSQVAIPMLVGGRPVGVLFVESPEDARFHWEDEDALVAVASQLGMTIATLQQAAEGGDEPGASAPQLRKPRGTALEVRHYRADDSVFIGDDYLIKGVAGAVLWKLLSDHAAHGRTEFSNRELRLDKSLNLPQLRDNLETRLLLLRRRLEQRCPEIRLVPCARGRFALELACELTLAEAG